MRGLADYVMSGRWQAVTVAVMFGLIPGLSIVSCAVVALVTLRRGWQDGLQILLWALLPALLQWMLGDASAVLDLLAVLIGSAVLRQTQSWQRVVALVLLFGIALQWTLPWQTTYLARVKGAVAALLNNGAELQIVVEGEVVKPTPAQLVDALLHYYGAYQMLMMFGALLLARHWQAKLYNPGGFREEFHQLRIDSRLMLPVLIAVVAALAGMAPVKDWLFMLCMVPILQGLAVIHKVVALRKLGSAFLAMAYLLLMVAAPAYALLGFVDCVADFRKRLAIKTGNDQSS